MGFSHFWKFVNSKFGEGIGIEQGFDWTNEKNIANKPWIIIDWNNICMSTGIDVGGHLSLVERQIELLFGALVRSGARICVICDGEYHTKKRIAIKLGRIHSDLDETVDELDTGLLGTASEAMDSDDLATAMTYDLAKEAFLSVFAGRISKDTQTIADDVMYIYREADGEADPEIREFARARIKEGKEVIIMSGDASLILGVPSDNLSITKFEFLALQLRDTDVPLGVDNVVLKGKIYPIQSFLTALTIRCNEILQNNTNEIENLNTITYDILSWVVALLDGETARIRTGEYDDPRPIILYLKRFLLPRYGDIVDGVNQNILDLSVAVAIIRAWQRVANTNINETTENIDDFIVCLNTIRNNAITLFQIPQLMGGGLGLNMPPSPPPPVMYGLRSNTNDGQYLRNDASNLLYRFENRVPLGRVRNISGGNSNCIVSVNYKDNGVYYNGRISRNYGDGTICVTYSADNLVQDGCPGGLANDDVMTAMAVEVNNRHLASLDQGAPIAITHRVEWGNWTLHESLHEDTEALLSPLVSLVEQLSFINEEIQAEMYVAAGNDWSDLIEDIPEVSPGTVEAFNKYLRSLLTVIETDDADSDSDNARVCIHTSKVTLPSPLARYTVAGLLNNFVRMNLPLPLNGVIVSSLNANEVRFGLRFRTCEPGDPIDKAGAYCRHDTEPLYCSSATVAIITPKYAGPLLNLKQRAVYFDELIRTSGGSTVTGGGEAGPSLSPAERAVSVIFDSLGLSGFLAPSLDASFRSHVDIACVAIANCWIHLPCDERSRTYIVSSTPATDTAKVMFALIYSFISLLGRSCMTRLRPFSKNLVEKVATALLLSPLFAIYAMSAPTADGTPRPQLLNPLVNLMNYSNQLQALMSRLPPTGATKATDRLTDLLETVLSLVVELLGDVDHDDLYRENTGWTSHIRWFDISGVQCVLGLLERGRSVRACCESVNRVLGLNMEAGGGDGENVHPATLPAFITAVEKAVAAIVASLEGIL